MDWRIFAGSWVVLMSIAPASSASDYCVSHCDCDPGKVCTPQGRCQEVVCTETYWPVCGLEGKTYPNACKAEAAHVVVAHAGECGQVCGGPSARRCSEGELCDPAAGACGRAEVEGLCQRRPHSCLELYAPVCGCDGTTYDSDCERLRAGAAKDHDGPCGEEAQACRRDRECPRSSYCRFAPGTCGRESLGECAERPEVCAQIYAPVCGCDGKTYSNACTAAAAGVSVAAEGPCEGAAGSR